MKAWRDIEKRYKIVVYLAIAVFYYFILDIIIIPGLGHYFSDIGIIIILSLFFIVATLAYSSRSMFDGMMIGITVWAPLFVSIDINFRMVFPYLLNPDDAAPFILVVLLIFTILGTIVGIGFGFIGSKRRKDTSGGGNSDVSNAQRSENEVEARV